MRKVFLILGLMIISSIILIISCTKDKELLEQTTSNKNDTDLHLKSSTVNNDFILLECLNNPELDSYDKGGVFLDQDSLSENIIDSLLNHSVDIEPFVMELILISQENFTNKSFQAIIDCENIDNPTLENILLTKTPLHNEINDYVFEKREMVIEHNYDDYQKLISTCDGGVIFAEKIIEIYDCNSTSFLIVNPTKKSFINLCNCEEENTQKMLNSAGGSKWVKGSRTVQTNSAGDITKVTCDRPPTPKCVKAMPQNIEKGTISQSDNSIINFINSNSSDFIKGKKLINEEELSDVVLLELFKKVCDFDQFVFETIFLSQEKLSEKILVNLIMNENIPNEMLTNILIVNSPLEGNILNYIEKFRTDISIDYINQFSEKEILLSMCNQSLIIGDKIEIEQKHNHKEFKVYNKSVISMYSSISESNKSKFLVGGNNSKWVYGEISAHGGNSGYDIYICVKPPNKKCLKLAKQNK